MRLQGVCGSLRCMIWRRDRWDDLGFSVLLSIRSEDSKARVFSDRSKVTAFSWDARRLGPLLYHCSVDAFFDNPGAGVY